MIHVHGAKLCKPRVGAPRAVALMHLKQEILDTPVKTSSDDAPHLHALGRSRLASSVPVSTLRHKKFTLGEGFVELSKQFFRSRGGEGGDET